MSNCQQQGNFNATDDRSIEVKRPQMRVFIMVLVNVICWQRIHQVYTLKFVANFLFSFIYLSE